MQTAVKTLIVNYISSTSTNRAKIKEIAILIVFKGFEIVGYLKFKENKAHLLLHNAPYTTTLQAE